MSYSNLSKSSELFYPGSQDRHYQENWTYSEEPEVDNYNPLYQRMPHHAMLKKNSSPTPSYIDKTLSLNGQLGATSLNHKLESMRDKFFKTLTKNYRPKTPLLRGKPPIEDSQAQGCMKYARSGSLTFRNDTSPSNIIREIDRHSQEYKNNKSNAHNMLAPNDSYGHSNQFKQNEFGPFGQEEFFESQDNREINDLNGITYLSKDHGERNASIYNNLQENNTRILNNSRRHESDAKSDQMYMVGKKLSIVSLPNNVNSQEHDYSGTSYGNQNSMFEENHNYSHMRNFEKEEENKPQKMFVMLSNEQTSPMTKEHKLYQSFLRGKLSSFNNGQNDPFRRKGSSPLNQSINSRSTTRGATPSFVKKQKNLKSPEKKSPKKSGLKPVYKGNTFGNYISNENDEEGWFPGGQKIQENKEINSVGSSEYNDKVESVSNVKALEPLDKRFIENNTTDNDKSLPSTRRTNLSTFQVQSDDYRLRTLSQVTDRLDPLEEVYTRQKGCLNLAHSLHSITFKRINSIFQGLKKSINSEEMKLSFSQKNKTNFLALVFQKQGKKSERTLLLNGFLRLNNMMTALKISLDRTKQFAFRDIMTNSSFQPMPQRERMTAGLLLLSQFSSAKKRSFLSQSLNSLKIFDTVYKYKQFDKVKTEKLIEAFTGEKDKLMREITSLQEKLKLYEKDKYQKNDLNSFMKSMQAPKGPVFSHEASINSKTNLSERGSAYKVSPNTSMPIHHETIDINSGQTINRGFNAVEEPREGRKLSEDARKMFVQPSDLKKWPSNSNLDLDSISNVQESDQLSASISFNQIDTSRVLSETPEQSSARNPNTKRADPIQEFMKRNLAKLHGFTRPEDQKPSKEKILEQNNQKMNNTLMKGPKGFSFNNTDDYEVNLDKDLVKKSTTYQHEDLTFTSVNGMITDSLDHGSYRLSHDPSEIVRERIGEMKNIRDVTHDFDDIDNNNSMVASERGVGH